MSTQRYAHKTRCITWMHYQITLHYRSYATFDFCLSKFRTSGSTAISACSHCLALDLQGKAMRLFPDWSSMMSSQLTYLCKSSITQRHPPLQILSLCCTWGAGAVTWFPFLPEMHNFQHSVACEMHTAESSCINIYIYFRNTDILKSPRGLPSLKMYDTHSKNAEVFLIIQPCVQSKGVITSMVTLPNGKFATHATCWHWLQHWPSSST